MIYFLQNGDPNLVKIGYAKDPKSRKRDLQTGSPTKLKHLIPPIDGGLRDEKRLHRMFDLLRVRGEWFRLENDLKAFIEAQRQATVKTYAMPLFQFASEREQTNISHLNQAWRLICDMVMHSQQHMGKVPNAYFWELKTNLECVEFRGVMH